VWVKPGSDDAAVAKVIRRREDGPKGANLVVYQVPIKWTETDIYQHFAHFGTIVGLWLDRGIGKLFLRGNSWVSDLR